MNRAPKRDPRPLSEVGETCVCGHGCSDHDPETWDCCARGCQCVYYEPDLSEDAEYQSDEEL